MLRANSAGGGCGSRSRSSSSTALLRARIRIRIRIRSRTAPSCVAMDADPGSVRFCKYHGLGNDFILIDQRRKDAAEEEEEGKEPVLSPEQAIKVCDRNFGVGGDGVIFALPPENSGSDYSMRIYNSDGTEPEMCGNGIRCLAKFVAAADNVEQVDGVVHKVDTLGGLIVPQLRADGQVTVDMGAPILQPSKIPTLLDPASSTMPAPAPDTVVAAPLAVSGASFSATPVSMGNPHCVIFAQDGSDVDLGTLDFEALGPQVEAHQTFPAKVNAEFCQVLSRQHIVMKVFERGAGPTLACGTGACAVVVAGVLENRCERKCRVDLPGGPLEIYWDEATDHVFMTGPAELVFEGTLHAV